MNTTFDSCRQVSLPSTGGLIMDTMACVNYGTSQCTPQRLYFHCLYLSKKSSNKIIFRFFEYMGLSNPFLPFPMYYEPADNEDVWIYEAKNCNETYEVQIKKL